MNEGSRKNKHMNGSNCMQETFQDGLATAHSVTPDGTSRGDPEISCEYLDQGALDDLKAVDTDGRKMNFHREECDDARRWRFIHSTQEGFCNESQANQIAALCNLWDQLRFAPYLGMES